MNPQCHFSVHQVLLLQVYQPGTDQDYLFNLWSPTCPKLCSVRNDEFRCSNEPCTLLLWRHSDARLSSRTGDMWMALQVVLPLNLLLQKMNKLENLLLDELRWLSLCLLVYGYGIDIPITGRFISEPVLQPDTLWSEAYKYISVKAQQICRKKLV